MLVTCRADSDDLKIKIRFEYKDATVFLVFPNLISGKVLGLLNWVGVAEKATPIFFMPIPIKVFVNLW
jgi:hypothetical protein